MKSFQEYGPTVYHLWDGKVIQKFHGGARVMLTGESLPQGAEVYEASEADAWISELNKKLGDCEKLLGYYRKKDAWKGNPAEFPSLAAYLFINYGEQPK